MNSLIATRPFSITRARTQPSFSDASPLRPPLKWAGGKRWQLPHLRPLWSLHSHRRLVEPFAGGLAVALGLRPATALLNDINPHVINFYLWVQQGLRVEIAMVNSRSCYDRSRKRFNALIRRGLSGTSEAGELFYYLNRTGYNGLCRFNRRGEYNVPFGTHKSIEYERDFSAYSGAFKTWSFASIDFDDLMILPSDFIYADPPYDVEFTAYSKEQFTWEDQQRLAHRLADHRGPVVLSNQATPRIVRLYRKFGFKLTFLDAPRMISCNGDRSPAREVLAIKNI